MATPAFVRDDNSMSFTADAPTTGPVPRSAIVDFWKAKPGVKPHVAEGIADALHTESGIRGTTLYDPLAVNPTSGATGLAQDLGPRKTNLQNQPDWTDPNVQLANMYREVTGGDKTAAAHWNEVLGAPDRATAKKLWAQYFERSEGTGRGSAPGWNPTPNAIASEQAKSNTDVRYMTPEEYLSLLPPIESNAANRAKRDNLKASLDAGDDIESIPSLDVTPKGSSLHVADWDGRNRAQAAIDAGVDEIPVAVRGVPTGKQDEFTLLVGNGKKVSLPYTFAAVPPPAPKPLTSPEQQARQTVPLAFTQPAAQPIPPQALPQPTAPMVPPSSKPDFYPEIVAGINNDVVNPRGIGYRGTGVPDLATNATAGGRIAAANANSAGQVGLGGAIGSALSALNPIGTAQAAPPPQAALEGAPPAFIRDEPGISPGSNVPPMFTRDPTPMGPSGGFSRDVPPPSGYAPSVPGLDTVAPPLANFLFSYPRAVAAGIAAAVAEAGNPKSLADWSERKAHYDAQMQVHETPVGKMISSVLNSPGALLAAGVNTMAEAHIGGLTPERVAAAAPYVDLIATILPGLGLALPRLGHVLSAPAQRINSRLFATPEMKAARAINKNQPAELAAGGIPAPVMANELAKARRAGIPLRPMDLLAPGGPQENLLGRSIEYSPEAATRVGQLSKERIFGTPTSPRASPTGGMLERMEDTAQRTFGPGSATDVRNALKASIPVAARKLSNARNALSKAESQIEARRKQLVELGATPKGIRTDPDMLQYKAARTSLKQNKNVALRDFDRQTNNKIGLDWGQDIFKPSVRVEHIRDFLKTANPEAVKHLHLGIQDAARLQYRRAKKGDEPFKLALSQENRNKVVAAFGNSLKKADGFMHSVDLEALISTRTTNLLQTIRKDKNLSENDKRRTLLFAEAFGHLASGIALGHGIYSGPYWLLRSMRNLGNMMVGGAGLAPRRHGAEIAELFSNPNAQLATSGSGLFATPPRPTTVGPRPSYWEQTATMAPADIKRAMQARAASQGNVNALSRASIPLSYGALAPQPEVPAQ